MICKGQDRCLYVFPVTEFGRVTDALRTAPVTDRRVRDYGRVLFASASNETPDGQGRITVPPHAAPVRGPDQGLRRHRREHPHRGLGRRRVAGVPRGHRARRSPTSPRRCCPACSDALAPSVQPHDEVGSGLLPCASWRTFPGARRDGRGPDRGLLPTTPHQHDSHRTAPTSTSHDREGAQRRMDDRDDTADEPAGAAHVPVLLERVLALLGPRLADRPAVAVDATLGLGGHAEALLAAHPQLTLVGLDRDPAALARSRARLAPYAGAHPPRPRRLRPDRRRARRTRLAPTASTACCSTSGSRRCSSTSPSAASPTRRTRRWTCAWTRAPAPTAEQVVNAYPVPELARVLREYGEERFALRIAQAIDRRAPGGPAAVDRPTGRAGASGDPRRDPPDRGPPSQTHLPGAAHRGQRRARRGADGRARRPRRAARSAAGSPCSPTTRWRTGSSSRRSPRWPPTPRRPDLPVPLPEHGPQLRLLTRGAEPAGEAEIAANPRAASVRLRAAERIRRSGVSATARSTRAHARGAAATRGTRRAGSRSRCWSSASIVGGMALLLALNTASAANELRRHDLAAQDAERRRAGAGAAQRGRRQRRARRPRPRPPRSSAWSRPASRPSSSSARTARCAVMGRPGAAQRGPARRRDPRRRSQADEDPDGHARRSSATKSAGAKSTGAKSTRTEPVERDGDTGQSRRRRHRAPPAESDARTPTPTPTPTVTLPGGDR